MSNDLRSFLALSYDELEELNLKAKEQRKNRVAADQIQEERLKYLTDEKRIKAVTVLFSDLEGRLHMLDYDKKFLVKSWDNLTFDGSSIRGFTAQRESDLRLGIDWSAFYWAPADVFGAGKVIVFGEVIDKDGAPVRADIRGVLKAFAHELHEKNGYTLNAANEIEGFLFDGVDAERRYHETGKFEYVNTGGYYHSLPGDPLRTFIDTTAEVQRAMGFENEKDHPEVAPSQFEINYGYGEVVAAADQIQLYKLICRQVATSMGMHRLASCPSRSSASTATACTPTSRSAKTARIFSGIRKGEEKTEPVGLAVHRPHSHRTATTSACCSTRASTPIAGSIRTSRRPIRSRLPPMDRGSMVRVPIGNEKSSRVEVRSVGSGRQSVHGAVLDLPDRPRRRDRPRSRTCARPSAICPTTSTRQSKIFADPKWTTKLLGEDVKGRYADLKQASADRCPRLLGTLGQGARNAVPPRCLQPVPVEPVLSSPLHWARSHFESRPGPGSRKTRGTKPSSC